MNVVERLEAAITKLEQVKAESTTGPWTCDLFGNVGPSGAFVSNRIAAGMRNGDSHAVVVLHRTIDAQLAILNDALLSLKAAERISSAALSAERIRHLNQLALADAILGDAS